MNFEKLLTIGVEKNIINENQKNSLIDLYNENNNESKQISPIVKIFFYIGGLIMLVGMTILMSHTVQHSSYFSILSLGTIYAILFLSLGEYLWRINEKFPAGILYFLFITLIGFILLDIEKMTGFFPHFSDLYKKYTLEEFWKHSVLPVIILSSLTILANSYLQKFRKTSCLAVPTMGCAYMIFLSLILLLFGWDIFSKPITNYLSVLLFSLGLIIIAFKNDGKTEVDYSKWLYSFGAAGIFMTIFLILEDISYDMPFWQVELIYFVLSLIYILTGLLIRRKAFSVWGIFGLIQYILFLECTYIENITLRTSIVLITGLFILYAGVLYSKNADKTAKFLEDNLPQNLKKYLPENKID